jgi:ribosomal-protein-alanine N-acetyltransferase
VTTAPTENDPVQIRPAVRADLLAINRIERASFPQPWPFVAFERYLGKPGFLVAEEGEAIVGYVVADVIPNHGRPLGHIKDIAVHPDRRGEGIGSTLIRRALSVLGARNVGSVKLEVRDDNVRAQSLYRDFGFEHQRTVTTYYENGDDALVMIKELVE